MQLNKKPWALPTICKMEKSIDPEPDYQRPPVWSRKQKQLLMDTILRNYDIPKFYWRAVTREDGKKYEVIDGQQRLRAIWEFASDGFPLGRDIDPIDGYNVAGRKYSDLPDEVMEIFDTYSIDVVVVTDAQSAEHEEEVRDMFLRLQNGTTLKAQEKRNARTGRMRDFVKEVSAHHFFESCKFANARFTYDHIAAQTILIELEGGPTNVKDADLNRMYDDQRDFDRDGPTAKKVRRTYDFLAKAFPEKTPELERYNVINLYCLASLLIDGYVWQDLAEPLADWFIKFEGRRKENDKLADEERDWSLVEYKRLTSYSTDAEESIGARLKMLEERFFLAHPDIKLKDPTRTFSHEQRIAIFRRDRGRCQLKLKCDGKKVAWDNWHADHIAPHVAGGETTVSNGQIACPACNQAKGADN